MSYSYDDFPDHYFTLGVNVDADPSSIRSAYKKLALKNHPDKCPEGAERDAATERMKKINEAYDTLKDEVKRKEYDNLRPAFAEFCKSQYNPFTFQDKDDDTPPKAPKSDSAKSDDSQYFSFEGKQYGYYAWEASGEGDDCGDWGAEYEDVRPEEKGKTERSSGKSSASKESTPDPSFLRKIGKMFNKGKDDQKHGKSRSRSDKTKREKSSSKHSSRSKHSSGSKSSSGKARSSHKDKSHSQSAPCIDDLTEVSLRTTLRDTARFIAKQASENLATATTLRNRYHGYLASIDVNYPYGNTVDTSIYDGFERARKGDQKLQCFADYFKAESKWKGLDQVGFNNMYLVLCTACHLLEVCMQREKLLKNIGAKVEKYVREMKKPEISDMEWCERKVKVSNALNAFGSRLFILDPPCQTGQREEGQCDACPEV